MKPALIIIGIAWVLFLIIVRARTRSSNGSDIEKLTTRTDELSTVLKRLQVPSDGSRLQAEQRLEDLQFIRRRYRDEPELGKANPQLVNELELEIEKAERQLRND